MNLSIAKGLVYKKRLIEKLQEVNTAIQRKNSVQVIEGNIKRDVDIPKLVESRKKLVNGLMNLKLVLWDQSSSIRHLILLLAELKSEIVFLESIQVSHGKTQTNGYSGVIIVEHDAILKEEDIVKKKKELKKRIDEIQDQIEQFNYTNSFEFEDVLGQID